jgi:hypothetical protein
LTTIIEETPQQLPLPDPDALPAWVRAALDSWDTSHATYWGLDILKAIYKELQTPYHLEKIEQKVFRRLKILARVWQKANFRTYITSFEQQILDAEIEALRKPYSTRLYVYERQVYDGEGDYYRVTEESYQHDTDFIVRHIQRKLGSYGVIMGNHQILHTLHSISAVLDACDKMDIKVEIVQSHQRVLQYRLRKAG